MCHATIYWYLQLCITTSSWISRFCFYKRSNYTVCISIFVLEHNKLQHRPLHTIYHSLYFFNINFKCIYYGLSKSLLSLLVIFLFVSFVIFTIMFRYPHTVLLVDFAKDTSISRIICTVRVYITTPDIRTPL